MFVDRHSCYVHVQLHRCDDVTFLCKVDGVGEVDLFLIRVYANLGAAVVVVLLDAVGQGRS